MTRFYFRQCRSIIRVRSAKRIKNLKKQLENGLVLRSLSEGYASDQEGLPQFYFEVFAEADEREEPELKFWTRDLIADTHPTTTLDDIWVVVDGERIVSALLLIPQTWRYEDVEFGLGRVELVATHKDYRRRGLVRELFDVLHQRSAELGHLVQAITGIPYYYRQFGYAFAVNLGGDARLDLDVIPELKDDEEPQFNLRQATVEDVPLLVAWDEQYAQQCLLSTVRDEAMWRYELVGRSPRAVFNLRIYIIESHDGEPVGYVAYQSPNYRPYVSVFRYIVGEQTSYLATFDDVMRGIRAEIDERFKDHVDTKPQRIGFSSDLHPVIGQMAAKMPTGQVTDNPYAWYIRVPDLPAFMRHIAPVLERRLRGSAANGYTGTLTVRFYDLTLLTFTFEAGRLQDVVHEVGDKADAGFPYHAFLNLVFGHRTIDELRYALPEIYANRNATILLEILFPKRRSGLMGLA